MRLRERSEWVPLLSLPCDPLVPGRVFKPRQGIRWAMKAVAVARIRAPPERMELERPRAGPGEVLVRVEFAGMNPYDAKIANGVLEGRPHVFPLILGVDAAGLVEEVGDGVHRFRAGDRIFGQFLHDPVGTGTYAEFAPVPERIGVTHVPSSLTSYEAAALPTAGMTALDGLETLKMTARSTLVIVGASGGVGSFATAMASARGVRVIAVARGTSSARLRATGAQAVVDPSSIDPVGEVRALCPTGVDGLLDVMSDRATFARWASVVHRGGVAATTIYVADSETLAGSGVRTLNLNLEPSSGLLDRLVDVVGRHHLPVPVERRIRLDEAPQTLADIQAGKASGKTVIDLRP